MGGPTLGPLGKHKGQGPVKLGVCVCGGGGGGRTLLTSITLIEIGI